MSLARVAGGLLTGIGRGLEAQGTAQLQQQRDDALFRRQLALARYGHELDVAREEVTQEHRVELDTAQTKNRMTATSAELTQRGTLAAQEDQREQTREIARERRTNREWDRRQEADYNRWRRQNGVEENNWRSRQQYIQENNPDRTIRWITRDDGMEVGYIVETGDTIETGIRARPESSDTFGGAAPSRSVVGTVIDSAASSVAQAGRGRTRRGMLPPAAGGEPSGESSTSREPDGNTYTAAEYAATLADARSDSRFRGMNDAQIREIVNRALRERGMRLAPNGR